MIKFKWPRRDKAHTWRGKRQARAFSTRDAMKIEHWIEGKYWLRDSSLQQAADEAGVGRKQMSRYFRIMLGKSFPQWRTEARINEAKLLLINNMEIPTAIVGEAVGISDKSNFRCLFKRVTGMTPAQWRLKHQVHVDLH